MNKLEVFKYTDRQVRTVVKDGEPWFVAKDVCEILEIGNTSDCLSRLDNDEKNTIVLNEGIGNPTKTIVNESGLYSLILGSRKLEAKAFKRWVTHEVIPSIRRTGGYSDGGDKMLGRMDSLMVVMTKMVEGVTSLAMSVADIGNRVAELEVRGQRSEMGTSADGSGRSRATAPTDGSCLMGQDGETAVFIFPTDTRSVTKIEGFPLEMKKQVDSILDEMVSVQDINFSRIARFCTLNGHPISSPSVRRYFDKRFGS